jgi:hypothetical protein
MALAEYIGYRYFNAGAPVAGTDEVQTLTIGGTGGAFTFGIRHQGRQTAAIAWSAVNATLLNSINAALDALFGTTAQVVATAGTVTAGIGTVILTFSGANVAKRAWPTMTAYNITAGSTLTVAIAETTPGVDASARGAPKGAVLIDTTNGKAHINTGSPASPVWTVIGAQT